MCYSTTRPACVQAFQTFVQRVAVTIHFSACMAGFVHCGLLTTCLPETVYIEAPDKTLEYTATAALRTVAHAYPSGDPRPSERPIRRRATGRPECSESVVRGRTIGASPLRASTHDKENEVDSRIDLPKPQNALAHPGIAVRDVIRARGLSLVDAAKQIGVTAITLSRITNGRAGVSPDMALKLENFGAGAAITWVFAQAAFDLAQRQRRNREL
jgi:addiction module HigA family antidote